MSIEKKHKTNVLMLLDHIFENGNDYRVIRSIQALRKNGFEVILICVHNGKLPIEEVISDTKVFRLIDPVLFRPKSLFGYRKSLAAKLSEQFEFDVIFGNDHRMLDLGYRIKLLNPSKILVYDSHEFLQGYHLDLKDEPLSVQIKANIWRKIEQKREREIGKHADFVLTVNYSLAVLIHYCLNLKIQPYSVKNIPEFTESPNLQSYSPEIYNALEKIKSGRNLIMFGFYYKGLNGFESLLKAMKSLPEDVTLIQVGKDRSKGYYDELVAEYGIGHRVLKINHIPQHYLKPIASYAKIGMVPTIYYDYLTLYYSLPNKFFDSLKLELPIICTSLPEQRRIIEQFNNGVLTHAMDWDQSTLDIIAGFHEIMNNFDKYKANAIQANQQISSENEYHEFIQELKRKLTSKI